MRRGRWSRGFVGVIGLGPVGVSGGPRRRGGGSLPLLRGC